MFENDKNKQNRWKESIDTVYKQKYNDFLCMSKMKKKKWDY